MREKVISLGILVLVLSLSTTGLIIRGINASNVLAVDYSISWSGTTAQGYKVHDSDSGSLKIRALGASGDTIRFKKRTSSVNALRIKVWINCEIEEEPYICRYTIKADYSSVEVTDTNIPIPGNITGGGHGSWDWQDSWRVTVKELTLAESQWGVSEWLVLASTILCLLGGAAIVMRQKEPEEGRLNPLKA